MFSLTNSCTKLNTRVLCISFAIVLLMQFNFKAMAQPAVKDTTMPKRTFAQVVRPYVAIGANFANLIAYSSGKILNSSGYGGLNNWASFSGGAAFYAGGNISVTSWLNISVEGFARFFGTNFAISQTKTFYMSAYQQFGAHLRLGIKTDPKNVGEMFVFFGAGGMSTQFHNTSNGFYEILSFMLSYGAGFSLKFPNQRAGVYFRFTGTNVITTSSSLPLTNTDSSTNETFLNLIGYGGEFGLYITF